MKGLLLKDFYTAKKYCRSLVFITAVFIVCSAFYPNAFYIFYPVILVSMLPVQLISYDERSKWQSYADTMPYSRRNIVASKYIFLIINLAIVLIMELAAQTIYYSQNQWTNFSDILPLFLVLLSVGVAAPCIMLPIMFKFGSEKGRLLYFIMIGLLCACTFIFANGPESFGMIDIVLSPYIFMAPILAIAIVIPASYTLSVKFYQNREL